MSGPGCIKPSQDKRVLNFYSGTITYCLEIVVTSSLNLKMFFGTWPRWCHKAMGQFWVAPSLISFKDKQIVQSHWYVNEFLFLHKWDSFSQERFSTRLKWEFICCEHNYHDVICKIISGVLNSFPEVKIFSSAVFLFNFRVHYLKNIQSSAVFLWIIDICPVMYFDEFLEHLTHTIPIGFI